MGDDIIGSFSTLITIVSDVSREVINLPREHRQQYRKAVEETFQVLVPFINVF